MLESQSINYWTIFDYLNEDCWRAVLQYVPILDLIRTESTSRQWQKIVLQYLQGINICILDHSDLANRTKPNAHLLKIPHSRYALDFKSFNKWIEKLGPPIVATYCNNVETLILIRENCPNLESLTLESFHNRCSCCGLFECFPYNLNMDFKCLQGLYIISCNVSDHCVSHFIADKAVEELEFNNCTIMTGDFFNTIDLSNLGTLVLEYCDDLDAENLFCAIERLGDLKKLVLNNLHADIYKRIQGMLDKMPKLEYLELYNERERMPCYDYKPLLRLTHLKYLQVNIQLPDEAAEGILQGCKDLRTLEFWDCSEMSKSFVTRALCRWGARLCKLYLMSLDLDDDDVVAIISTCPQLTKLLVDSQLSPALPARAAAARRAVRPGAMLRLDVSGTCLPYPDELMLRAEPNNDSEGLTILDYLNEDCWRAVLQFVPVRDLVCSERTSRLWQTWVLMYLKGVRVSIVDEDDKPKKTHPNACTLKASNDDYESFIMWTNKVGTSVVAAYCNSFQTLKTIDENCPNLESLMLTNIRENADSEGMCPYNLNKSFNRLQGLHFNRCLVSDNFIDQFIKDKALEELEIGYDCCTVRGDFLNTINLSNLKSLRLEFLELFDSEHLRSAADQLSELTKLVIIDMPFETAEEIQHVVDKMEKLEYFELYDAHWMTCGDYEPISRLTRLKFLRLSMSVPDEGVEAILEGCKELETLELLDCRSITGSPVSEPFRHGCQLRSLTLHKFHCMGDDDLVDIISSCPQLTSLVVSAANLSPALPARAAAARSAVRAGSRLRLDLSDTILVEPEQLKERYGEYEPMKTEYEDLIIDLTVKDN
ncbi:uncharacterized protein LOC125226898 [Leguminivora glycinivorella]|uniref:uncharacterized protein LOC125226898 n=1 Tax=Leguminivora glycinivorella TaxID=1035111 RepID=UPI00200FC119|nr:uncharacterized protein LOC125226898 [Leguminivora glycinivorella]